MHQQDVGLSHKRWNLDVKQERWKYSQNKMYQQGWDESILKSMYQQGRWKYSQHDVSKDGHSEHTEKKVRCNLGVIILQQIKLTFSLCIRKPQKGDESILKQDVSTRSQRRSLRKYKEESQM